MTFLPHGAKRGATHHQPRSATARRWLLALVLTPALGAVACPLDHYELRYKTRLAGLPVTLVRTLTDVEGDCELQQKASALIGTLSERSRFRVIDGQIQPLHYEYRNPFRKSRSVDLRFDWQRDAATETVTPNPAVELHPGVVDRLSVQEQFRLDIARDGIASLPRDYTVLDDDKFKTYHISLEGEEVIDTKLGKRATYRLRQMRPGKDKYTLLWISKDAQLLPLKIQHIEDGKLEGELLIDAVRIDARPRPLTPARNDANTDTGTHTISATSPGLEPNEK